MSALSTRPDDHPVDRGVPSPGALPTADDYALGFQLCRAGLLSLTRLQLALDRGDRTRAMEAIDDLHRVDVEVERLVAALPLPADDRRQGEVRRDLKEARMALAFEKLALASGVSGPGLASAPAFSRPAAEPAAAADWPPAEARSARLVRHYGPRTALLLVIVAATAAALLMAL